MQQRSEFVTVVAWIFIVLSGLSLLLMIMDAAIFWMMPFDQLMQQAAALNPSQPQLPAGIMTTVFRWILAVILLLQGWMLASSIGLLLRKNWARISFIVLMVIGLVWNSLNLLVGLLAVVGIHMATKMETVPGMPPGFGGFMQVAMIFGLVFEIAILVLFGWILKKLISKNIREEFGKPVDTPGTLSA
jgi:hypothetical protein